MASCQLWNIRCSSVRSRFLRYWLPYLSLLLPPLQQQQCRTLALLSSSPYSLATRTARPTILLKGSRLTGTSSTRPPTALMAGPQKKNASAAKPGKRKKVSSSTEKKKPNNKEDDATASSDSDAPSIATPKKRAKATKKKAAIPKHQVLTTRDAIPKLWDAAKAPESYTFKMASWNVAGIRALLKKTPTVFADLVAKHNLDVLCLQETKLQEQHLDDPKLNLKETIALPGYEQYWSCSTDRKGYSGTAVFVRMHGSKKTKQTIDSFFGGSKSKTPKETTTATLPIPHKELVPTSVSYTMGKDIHDKEGRIIMVDLPLFSFCNVYVPNSGQKLDRLSYRVDQWDKDFLNFVQSKQAERPVLWLGDLNVAHTNLEVWNDGAKHLPKQAGVTPQERASFQEQLDSGFVDAFRKLHPGAGGHYTYWSQRAGNRVPNKGLRLDYFVCDPSFFDSQSRVMVRDSYMDHEQLGSDHCPAILELEIKKQS